jgi:hypothetical protein
MVVFDIGRIERAKQHDVNQRKHKQKIRIWVTPGAGRIQLNSGGYSAVLNFHRSLAWLAQGNVECVESSTTTMSLILFIIEIQNSRKTAII